MSATIIYGADGGRGDPVFSLNGAKNFHDACTHREVYNQFLHVDTGITTTLSIAASAGDYQLNFTDASSFSIGDELQITDVNFESMFFTILDIVANLVTIDTPVNFGHAIGTEVIKIYTNIAETGLTTGASLSAPVVFTSHVPVGMFVHVTSMTVVMTDTSAMDFTKFGGLVALVNGCVLRAQSGGRQGHYTNWKSNFDMDSDAFPVHYQEKTGGGEYGLSAVYQIKEFTGSIVFLDGALNDRFEMLVRDAIDGLTNFKIKLQGHYEGTH